MNTMVFTPPTVAYRPSPPGLKTSLPKLQVWILTGDGDGLSIGGNHLIHALRRNIDLKILFFNNRIYGLAKERYYSISEQGKKIKSTPHGSVDYPLNPLCLALVAKATFVARTIDADSRHLVSVRKRVTEHKKMRSSRPTRTAIFSTTDLQVVRRLEGPR